MKKLWIIFGLSIAICQSASGQNNSKNAMGNVVNNKGVVAQDLKGDVTINNNNNYSGSTAKEKPEDLRVSFRIDQATNSDFKITYIFRNLGSQEQLINAIGLFEMVTEDEGDTKDKIALCDTKGGSAFEARHNPLTMMTGGMFIFGDAKGAWAYNPVEISVGGKPHTFGQPFAVEGGKSLIVDTGFKLIPDHFKDKKAVTFCPVVQTLDVNNKKITAICRALARVYSQQSTSTEVFSGQFKILPQSRPYECREPPQPKPQASRRSR